MTATISAPTSARTLALGQRFVWVNDSETREQLCVDPTHMLGEYRVVSRETDRIEYEHVGNGNIYAKYITPAMQVLTLTTADETAAQVGAVLPRDEAVTAAGIGGQIGHGAALYDVISVDDLGRYRVQFVEDQPSDRTIPAAYLTNVDWTVTRVGAAAPAPAPATPGVVIPRTLADITRMRSALDTIAKWTAGGELNTAAERFAHDRDLCGQYEALVCPTFGWPARDGRDREHSLNEYKRAVDRFEREHGTTANVVDVLESWAARFETGGELNTAANEFTRGHLESYKQPSYNELCEQFGWDPLETNRDFIVYADVVRYRTVRETQRVAVTVSSQPDEESAIEYARENEELTQYASDYNWTVDDDEYEIQDTEEDWDNAEAEED